MRLTGILGNNSDTHIHAIVKERMRLTGILGNNSDTHIHVIVK